MKGNVRRKFAGPCASGVFRSLLLPFSIAPLFLGSFFLGSLYPLFLSLLLSFFLLAPSLLLSHARKWGRCLGTPGPENLPLGLYSLDRFQLKIAPWNDISYFLHLLERHKFLHRFRHAIFRHCSILDRFWLTFFACDGMSRLARRPRSMLRLYTK